MADQEAAAGTQTRGRIDLKGLLKLATYNGEKEGFLAFKLQLYMAMRVIKLTALAKMEYIEKHLNQDYKLATMDETERAEAQ